MPSDQNKPDPLAAILSLSVDEMATASLEEQHLLLMESELRATRARLATVERENKILLQAVRKSEYHLGRHIEPGGPSAYDCINALLRVLDNDEINEVTRRENQ